jgi:hypothetical protein
MGTERTAWHYYLGVLLRERCPSWAEVEVEVPLTREVQRLDYLLLRRRRRGSTKDRGGTLRDLWPLLPRETLAEFKSASKGYRERGLHKLLGYGFQYFSEGPQLLHLEDLCLVLLLGSATPRSTGTSRRWASPRRPWRRASRKPVPRPSGC